jgi:hypothetical protein
MDCNTAHQLINGCACVSNIYKLKGDDDDDGYLSCNMKDNFESS